MAVIGGVRSDLSITRATTNGNFGNVSAGALFSKVTYQRKRWLWRWFLLWIILSTAAFCLLRGDGHLNSSNYMHFWAYLAFPHEQILDVEDSYSHRRQLTDEDSLES